MSERLLHKGRPVPYIAAWTGERKPQPRLTVVKDGIAFAGAVTASGFAQGRDTNGALWQRWALRQGDGEPLLGVVHGPRQRRAMRKLLCQVCGGPSDKNEQGHLWLLEDYWGVAGWPERENTVHPPVWRPCAPVAARLCPHLMGKCVAVRVGRVEVDGVYGNLYERGRGPGPVLCMEKTTLYDTDWRVQWTLATQLAAPLHDVTLVDVPGIAVGDPAACR
ncbi:hypothetical protein ACWD4G_07420 [Streptomyces sp. NPDC002643]